MRAFVFAALLSVALPRTAAAGEPFVPVCARPAVLDRVAALLREAGRPMRLEAFPTGEASVGRELAGRERIVHCATRGRVLGYDTNRYGMQPVDEVFVVNYTLELRHNGIFLSLR